MRRKLKALRKQVGLSRRSAARLAGVNPATLALFEADPAEGVQDPRLVARLNALYARLEALAEGTLRAAS